MKVRVGLIYAMVYFNIELLEYTVYSVITLYTRISEIFNEHIYSLYTIDNEGDM